MSTHLLLDDQPIGREQDQLHFYRFVKALESHVLQRESQSPFVVGIYGDWGSGKSSLLKMLAERLGGETERWQMVEFSPWLYRNEKSLLLPLLATLAKKPGPFRRLVNGIVESGPEFIKMLSELGFQAATGGLPLLDFLTGIKKQQDDAEAAKDLQEKIAEAVKETTQDGKRLVFLIDDLDRCHDPAQIVGLLEQIKLFLHLDNCLFFICAHKQQIEKAIDSQFPGEGRRYLEKFVQLALELPTHQSRHLAAILPVEDATLRNQLVRIAEVLDNNPRRLKQLWNRAVMALEIVKQETMRVQGFVHKPSMSLMLKWLLLQECGLGQDDPYRYLTLENNEDLQTEDFFVGVGLKTAENGWKSPESQRLAVFLWHDRDRFRFKEPRILSLYVQASGEDADRSRQAIEIRNSDGKATIQNESYVDANLSDGRFSGVIFIGCDFSRADFRNAVLDNVSFRRCSLDAACFDGAQMNGAEWECCMGLDALATEPVIYETIADAAFQCWQRATDSESVEPVSSEWDTAQLFKVYKTIIDLHDERGSLADDVKERLQAKGLSTRKKVLGIPTGPLDFLQGST
ncbi:MAG: AAA family ATPase [Gammaproteobacteria bacterium]|nr:AAA family ATPase [Gammaproteobacteria bacterium]MCP5425721.1 AAA family ATPase [Gammaproteobacteria bacterium]